MTSSEHAVGEQTAMNISKLPSAGSVRRQPLSQQVADTIRQMILVGQLVPEQTITQAGMASMLSVSTMPVREALLRLAHEGLIEARAGHSFRVPHTSHKDVEDVYRTHAFLAGELTARAVMNAGPELAADLRSIQEQWTQAEATELEVFNWQFHRIINQAAAAPKLLHFLRNTIRFIPQHFYGVIPEWRTLSDKDHAQIVLEIEAQNAEGARRAAEHHVREAGRFLIAHFSDTGYWAEPTEPDR